MQKLRIMSDLHLEFGEMEVPVLPDDRDTILILAGDIHVRDNAINFIAEMCTRFYEVIYVLGNHEFYYGEVANIRNWWANEARYYHNLQVLDPGVYEFNGLRIIGATLWTDTLNTGMENLLNDYGCITYGGTTLEVQDTYNMHERDTDFIRKILYQPYNGRTVVVTHHAPIPECVVPRYVGTLLNQCFHANLNELVALNDIDLWVHGHMHDTIDFTYGGTRIYCNPRGYKGHELNTGFRNDFVVEI